MHVMEDFPSYQPATTTGSAVAVQTGPHPIVGLVAAFLLSKKSPHTRSAYALDLGLRLRGDRLDWRPDGAGWLPFLTERGIAPLDARRVDVDGWVEIQRRDDIAETTIARRLSTLASWYDYLNAEEVTDRDPTRHVDRPDIDPDASDTYAPDREEARRLWRAALDVGPHEAAVISLMLHSALRVSEVCGVTFAGLRQKDGVTTVSVIRKRGKRQDVPLSHLSVRTLAATYPQRATLLGVTAEDLLRSDGPAASAPLLPHPTGRHYLRQEAADIVTQLGRAAGLAQRLGPHGLRHACITLALDEGRPLADVQDLAGHADPRTTRGYDRRRGKASRTAAVVGAVSAIFEDE